MYKLDLKCQKLDLKCKKLDLECKKLDFPAFYLSGFKCICAEKKKPGYYLMHENFDIFKSLLNWQMQ